MIVRLNFLILRDVHNYIIKVPSFDWFNRFIIDRLGFPGEFGWVPGDQAGPILRQFRIISNLLFEMLSMSQEGGLLSCFRIYISFTWFLLQHQRLWLHCPMRINFRIYSSRFNISELKLGFRSWRLNILLSRVLSFLNRLFRLRLSHLGSRIHIFALFIFFRHLRNWRFPRILREHWIILLRLTSVTFERRNLSCLRW